MSNNSRSTPARAKPLPDPKTFWPFDRVDAKTLEAIHRKTKQPKQYEDAPL